MAAQPVHCDIQGQDPHLADVLVSQIANGDTTAWCFTHYVDVCQAVLDTARETAAEAAATDQEAADRLEGVTAPDQSAVIEGEPQAAPTGPAEPAGPDGGPGGEAGDQPDQEGLAGSPGDTAEEGQPTTAGV